MIRDAFVSWMEEDEESEEEYYEDDLDEELDSHN